MGAARQCHHASGRTASLNLASLPVPFLSAVHICMDTHLLPAGEETAKGQCPHSIQHLQYLPGVIRPLLLWCAHQPPVLSDSGLEGLCCRMPVDAPTDSDQDKTSTAPPPLLSAGPVQIIVKWWHVRMYVHMWPLSVSPATSCVVSVTWRGSGLCFARTNQCSCFLSCTTPG